jgi:hypothetical protein
MTPETDTSFVLPKEKHPLFQVTTFSKYLATALFVLLPFVGGYIGFKVALKEKQILPIVTESIKHQTSGLGVENYTHIYNYSGHNLYVVNNDTVGCLTEDDDKLIVKTLEGIDAASFQFITETYVKDKNSVYRVLCHRGKDRVDISRSEVTDVATFEHVKGLPLSAGSVFYDKNYVYLSLPQEFLLEKKEDIDRTTFEYIGTGRYRVVDIMEGLTEPTANLYFKDKNFVYVIDFGQFKKLEVAPETFTIAAYEQSTRATGE